MSQIIYPGRYSGELHAPASKSYLQRAIAIASVSTLPCRIHGYYPSKDALAALRIARTLGAKIEINGDKLVVEGSAQRYPRLDIHCGEAGLSARMFGSIAALKTNHLSISGEGSLLVRPMTMLIDALQKLGMEVEATEDVFLPICACGRLRPGDIQVDGSESSQVLTGLLITLPLLEGDSTVRVENLKSTPYIQMTLDILKHFGIIITHDDYKIFDIKGNQTPHAESYAVEGDWSGAAFHLVGAAISGSIRMYNLNQASSQADIAILEALQRCGAVVVLEQNSIWVEQNELRAFEFDATDCPDLFPPLAVLAAACMGKSTLIGTDRLMYKESDRAMSLQAEMVKTGVKVSLSDNKMHITGGTVHGATVSSHQDHRIAMAMAVLANLSRTPIEILDAEAVSKSYPTFFDDFKAVSLPI